MSSLSVREWAVCHRCLYVSGLSVTVVCALVGCVLPLSAREWAVRHPCLRVSGLCVTFVCT